MPADCGLRKLKHRTEFCHSQLSAIQYVQKTAPRGIGERIELIEDARAKCRIHPYIRIERYIPTEPGSSP